MRRVLHDGLAFAPLLSAEGYYHSCAGSGPQDFGGQKHPPQLNPLAYLPLSSAVTAPTQRAYDLRYRTTDRAQEPYFYGWTLAEFLLASTRMGDVAGWRQDWANVSASGYVDADWIQIYETSRAHQRPFYVTSHGLFAQSIIDCLVSTWWNELQVGHCLPWSGECSFSRVRTLLGVEASGQITPEGASVTLRAGKDTAFRFCQEDVAMGAGEEREFGVPVSTSARIADTR
jgi:hypothetical protein